MNLNKGEFNLLIVFAFRYALGRRSMAPGIVCDLIRKNSGHLTEMTRTTIIYEIDYAYEHGLLGDSCDVDDWLRLKKELEE